MYWYRIDIDQSEKTQSVMGGSELSPSELDIALQGEGYVLLKALFYRDAQRRFQKWSEWDSSVKEEIWINPKRVITFQELAAKPETE
ncbi:hypothetical protein [Armatimonas sp.]|uniref:hypothetical protein n=1 Tax=Armatimonas sp. TaxID=1872638 RepID=UPI0037514409